MIKSLHKIFLVMWGLFLINSSIVLAQTNLVLNPSFESYSACPTGSSQIDYASPWKGTNNSTDYYNACAPSCVVSVPCQTTASYQYAHTGVAIAGMWFLNNYGLDKREYIQGTLFDTLMPHCYKVSFFVNNHNSIKYAINNFGLYFSTDTFTTSWSPAPYIPQVVNFNNKIINDTLNWIEISGIYVANGGEKYITIGNFKDDANTDTLDTGNGTYPGAYYYIDDVSVIPIDSIPGGMPADAGPDTNVVLGDSVFVGQEISNLNCNWYDSNGTLMATNISGIYVQPTTSTYYVVEQNLCGTITYDTVNVAVLPTGIHEINRNLKVILYPNPSTGMIYVNLDDDSSDHVKVSVQDVRGKVIYASDELEVINGLSNFKLDAENGVYFVTLSNSKYQVTRKLLIQQ